MPADLDMPTTPHPAAARAGSLAAFAGALGALLLAACAPAAAPGERAALVIDPGDGHPLTRCVEFPGPTTTGVGLLERSGLPLAYDVSGNLGTLVCSIAGTGCEFPAEPCLCHCSAGADCRFW